MSISITNEYSASVDKVYEAFLDEQYAEEKYAALGQRAYQRLRKTESGQTTTIEQTREVRANVPSFAKKVLSEWNTLNETFVWTDQGDEKHCIIDTDVGGAPIRLSGSITLKGSAEMCSETIELSIDVKVPIIGKKIAKMVEEDTRSSLAEEAAFNTRYLSD